MESGTTPAVLALTVSATIAAVYAFICDIRQDRIARRLRSWVHATYPGVWPARPWWHPQGTARIALATLVRQRAITDQAFVDRYSPIARLERRKWVAMAVTASFVGLVLVGTTLWDWSW